MTLFLLFAYQNPLHFPPLPGTRKAGIDVRDAQGWTVSGLQPAEIFQIHCPPVHRGFDACNSWTEDRRLPAVVG